jgi:hypothetical protein
MAGREAIEGGILNERIDEKMPLRIDDSRIK